MARPQRSGPPSLETHDVRVAAVGAIAWTIALIVLLIIGLPKADRWWLWVCAVGIATGLFGVWYIPRLQRGWAAQIGGHAVADRAPGRQSSSEHGSRGDHERHQAAHEGAAGRDASRTDTGSAID